MVDVSGRLAIVVLVRLCDHFFGLFLVHGHYSVVAEDGVARSHNVLVFKGS